MSLWLRCKVDEWHLDCLAGADLDLNRSVTTSRNHDYIAAVRRKEDGTSLEFFVSPSSNKKIFESNGALNDYLRAVGLEEILVFISQNLKMKSRAEDDSGQSVD